MSLLDLWVPSKPPTPTDGTVVCEDKEKRKLYLRKLSRRRNYLRTWERKRAKERARRASKPEAERQRCREYHHKNKERLSAVRRAYYLKNREQILARRKERKLALRGR